MAYGSPAWASLIAQIRRAPRSVELRDIAADYLLAHDDPRGEFIVLRNRLEAGAVPPHEYVAVYERHRELEREQPWKAQLDTLAMSWASPFTGFIERAMIDLAGFERLGELCRHEPLIDLDCRNLGALTPDLLDTPELAEIERLSVDEHSAALFASPRLANVRTLVATRRTSPEYFAALATSTLRPHRIELAWDEREALAMLAKSHVLDELRELPIPTDQGVMALDGLELAHLARLDLTAFSPVVVERLARWLDRVVALRADGRALALVTANVASGNLRELVLAIGESDVPGIVELIDSAACLQLRTLVIRGMPLPVVVEQAIRRLAFHGHLVEVRVESRRGDRIEIPNTHVIEVS